MKFPKSVQIAIDKLHAAGYQAYPVGGCVRDFLLGKPCSDFDITTNALPDETRAVFSEYPVITTGMRHGTVTVVFDTPLEITTFRIDRGYTDGRHPDAVEFTPSLTEDLARRDFTVNAMAYGDGEIIDPFGGKADLAARTIRCVGDPKTRFEEDALRILRALRFAATLDFEVEASTACAAVSCCEKLSAVSVERITEEVRKLALGNAAARVVTEFSSVLDVVLPGFSPDYKRLETLPPSLPLRLSALLGNVDTVRCLRLSNKEMLQVEFLLSAEVQDIRTTLRKFGEERARLLFSYHDLPFSLPDGIWSVSQLSVNGADLLARGLSGEAIGRTLEGLLDAVMRGEVSNEKDALLAKIEDL